MHNSIFSGDCSTGTAYLFKRCYALQHVILPSTDITGATSLAYTFMECTALEDVPNMASFKNITTLNRTFYSCTKLGWVKFTINPYNMVQLLKVMVRLLTMYSNLKHSKVLCVRQF